MQFRVAGLLIPLALVNPAYGLGLAVGVGLANLFSPFGWYDFLLMPIAILITSRLGYQTRSRPWSALLLMAVLNALAIAFFPLYLGGGIPWWPTAGLIFVSLFVLYAIGYPLLRRSPLWSE